ncbi:MAG: hypothetical protein IT434_19135 [Phycisphaerales bacterium]|nr:hypothetical protein [Phycisphaerales bacterium]
MAVPDSTPDPSSEALAPTPAGSRWGALVARIYLGLVGLALVLVVVEVARGERGLGAIAVTVLTAPWSGLLAPVAQWLAPSLPVAGLRALGFALAVGAALLNARVFYGIAARAERDARKG